MYFFHKNHEFFFGGVTGRCIFITFKQIFRVIVITQILYIILLQLFQQLVQEMMFIKIKEKKVILLLGVFLFAIAFCGPIAAHPGHGEVQEEEPSTNPSGGKQSGSTGSSSGSSQSSSSASNGHSSYYPDSTSRVTQSDGAAATETQTADQTATQNENAPENTLEEVSDTSQSNDIAGGPVAMIGLMVVIGLIAMSFPYTEGGTLYNLQIRLFGR